MIAILPVESVTKAARSPRTVAEPALFALMEKVSALTDYLQHHWYDLGIGDIRMLDAFVREFDAIEERERIGLHERFYRAVAFAKLVLTRHSPSPFLVMQFRNRVRALRDTVAANIAEQRAIEAQVLEGVRVRHSGVTVECAPLDGSETKYTTSELQALADRWRAEHRAKI